MKHFTKLCLILTLLFLPAVSSADLPKFLERYDQLTPGKYVDKYYYDSQTLHEKSYLTIQVKDVDVCYIKGEQTLKPKDAATTLKRDFQEAARASQVSRFFLFEESSFAKASLELAITEQSSGAPIGRFLFPGLGVGHPYFRIEGRIVDLETKHVLAAFTHFKAGRGIWFLKDIGGRGDSSVLKDMYADAASDIVKEIGDSFGYISEILQDGTPFKYN